MKHFRDNGQKVANVRVTLDMLPKGVQRLHRDKQLEIMKRLFKRLCNTSGVFHEMKEREYYVKPGEKRRKAERLKKANARGEFNKNNNNEREERSDKYFDEYN